MRKLVDKVSIYPQGLGRLLNYVLEHPDLATAADPHTPRQIQRLLAAAADQNLPVAMPRCQSCDRQRLLTQTLPDGRRVCDSCRDDQYIRPCSDCRRPRRVAKVYGGLDYCVTCWRRRPEGRKICAYCGRLAIIERRTDGGPQCARCAPGTILPCAGCGREERVVGYLLGGPRCSRCYNDIRKKSKTCPSCGAQRILDHLGPKKQPVCAHCAGQEPRFACTRCGSQNELHGRLCYACVTQDRLDALFTDDSGTTPDHLTPLKEAIAAAGRNSSIALWVRRSASAQLVRELVAGSTELSHDALDDYPNPQAAAAVRSLLVRSGLLPTRNAATDRYTHWLTAYLAQIDRPIAKVLSPFARWHLRQELRHISERRIAQQDQLGRTKAKVRAAEEFLAHLAEQGVTLGEARQGHYDSFLVSHPSQAMPIRIFIKWARNTRRTVHLRNPKLGHTLPSTAMAERQYHQLLDRLKNDTTIPPRARLTALLVGLYGQRVTRIAALPASAVSEDADATMLLLGDTPVRLPRVLSHLVIGQRNSIDPWDRGVASDWLFPSPHRAGSHILPKTLCAELRAHGIRAVPLRGAAMLNLAAQIPIKPICDLTGISPQAAYRWAQIAARAWNAYPSMRVRDSVGNAPVTPDGI